MGGGVDWAESTTGYTFTPCVGSFYFPWHRHQIEGTNGFYCPIRKTERFTISNVESQVFTPNNSRLDPGSNPGCPRDKRMSYHWTNCASQSVNQASFLECEPTEVFLHGCHTRVSAPVLVNISCAFILDSFECLYSGKLMRVPHDAAIFHGWSNQALIDFMTSTCVTPRGDAVNSFHRDTFSTCRYCACAKQYFTVCIVRCVYRAELILGR